MIKKLLSELFTVHPKVPISAAEIRRCRQFMFIPFPFILLNFNYAILLLFFPSVDGSTIVGTQLFVLLSVISMGIISHTTSFLLAKYGHLKKASALFVLMVVSAIYLSLAVTKQKGTVAMAVPYIGVLYVVLSAFNTIRFLSLFYVGSTIVCFIIPVFIPYIQVMEIVYVTIVNSMIFAVSFVASRARNQDEEELVQQHQQILYSSRLGSVGELASGVAHEINNPLAIIKGKAEVIKMKFLSKKISTDEAAEMCDSIVQSVERASQITKGLLVFGKNENDLKYESVQLSKLLKEVAQLMSTTDLARNVQFSFQVDPSLVIQCAQSQLKLAITNIYQNAIDATENLPQKWVNVEAHKTSNTVEIFITDSGSGVPDEIRDRIMDPFFTTKGPGKGVGLGLTISKIIIDSLGGKLRLDPKSKNTRFVIELPI